MEEIKFGKFAEPFEAYAANAGAFASSHWLSEFQFKGPVAYKRLLDGHRRADRRHFRVGRAMHVQVLEGQQEFEKRYVIGDGPINEKTNKPYGSDTKKYADWAAVNVQDGQELLSTEDAATFGSMAIAVRTHPVAAQILALGEAEAVFRTKIGDMPSQIRCDWVNLIQRYFTDFKTCHDIDEFAEQFFAYHYDFQLSFYREVLGILHPGDPFEVSVVAAEKKPPYRVGVWAVSSETLDKQVPLIRDACRRLRQCLDTNSWPTGYEQLRFF